MFLLERDGYKAFPLLLEENNKSVSTLFSGYLPAIWYSSMITRGEGYLYSASGKGKYFAPPQFVKRTLVNRYFIKKKIRIDDM